MHLPADSDASTSVSLHQSIGNATSSLRTYVRWTRTPCFVSYLPSHLYLNTSISECYLVRQDVNSSSSAPLHYCFCKKPHQCNSANAIPADDCLTSTSSATLTTDTKPSSKDSNDRQLPKRAAKAFVDQICTARPEQSIDRGDVREFLTLMLPFEHIRNPPRDCRSVTKLEDLKSRKHHRSHDQR